MNIIIDDTMSPEDIAKKICDACIFPIVGGATLTMNKDEQAAFWQTLIPAVAWYMDQQIGAADAALICIEVALASGKYALGSRPGRTLH